MLHKFFQNPEIRAYAPGHEAPSTESYNVDAPLMEMANSTDLGESLSNPRDLPIRLTLRAKLLPVKLDQKKTLIQTQVDEKVYAPQLLYGTSLLKGVHKDLARFSQNQAIRLIYTGLVLETEEGKDPIPLSSNYHLNMYKKDILFEKSFCVQTKHHMTQRKRFVEPTWITIPAGHTQGQVHILPTYGYGGYYKPGTTPIDHIVQAYFIISCDEENTFPQLQTTGFWQQKKCIPPAGGVLNKDERVVFMDSLSTQQCRSLGGDIQEGTLRITLYNQEKEIFAYESYAYTQTDLASSLVNIHFQLKKGIH